MSSISESSTAMPAAIITFHRRNERTTDSLSLRHTCTLTTCITTIAARQAVVAGT